MRARAGARFREFADAIRAALRRSTDAAGRSRACKILPLGPVAKTWPRLLAVGDAAGLVKPTTGGGIYYSLISGQIAADVLDEALAQTTQLVRDACASTRPAGARGSAPRSASAWRSALASRLTTARIDALVELARIDGIVPMLRQTADFNWHRPPRSRSCATPSSAASSLRRSGRSGSWFGVRGSGLGFGVSGTPNAERRRFNWRRLPLLGAWLKRQVWLICRKRLTA